MELEGSEYGNAEYEKRSLPLEMEPVLTKSTSSPVIFDAHYLAQTQGSPSESGSLGMALPFLIKFSARCDRDISRDL